MVRATSLFGRSVAILVSASLAATSCAEGASFGFATLKDFVQQFVSTNPGPHTDVWDENGNPIADIDWGHDHGAGDPHWHRWIDGEVRDAGNTFK